MTVLAAITAASAMTITPTVGTEEIQFSRDIQPILGDRCFACHGPHADARKAKLRLDTFEHATAARKRGRFAIVPGDLSTSLVWDRITADDPLDQMPPPDSGRKPLTADEKDLIRRWIESGAEYEEHWAFRPLGTDDLPDTQSSDWPRTPVDHYVLMQLQAEDEHPSPEVDPAALCRRVFLDLTGLPPTTDELNAFLGAQTKVDPLATLVDQLLTEEPYATRYAEHMATPWLDLARYADTTGIHMDAGRSIWPYRDWIIDAYRTNMPLDQFIIEQLAGDLIENATLEQQVASGFNRCHVTTDEGGAIDEEYLLAYAVDRTNTYGTVFLGLTISCSQCHDHKFDPITMEDYYGLLAFFNNNEEPGLYDQSPDPTRALEPELHLLSPERQVELDAIEQHLAALEAERAERTPDEDEAMDAFTSSLLKDDNWNWTQPAITDALSEGGATLDVQADGTVLASGENPDNDDWTLHLHTDRTDLRAILLEVLQHESLPQGGPGRAGNGNMILSGVEASISSTAEPDRTQQIKFSWGWADTEQPNGDFNIVNAMRNDDGRMWAINAHQDRGDRVAMFIADKPFGFEGGTEITVQLHFHSPYAKHSPGHVGLHLANASTKSLQRLPTAVSNWYIVGPFATVDGPQAYDTVFGPEAVGPLDFKATYKGQSWRHAPGVKEEEVVSLAQGIGAEFVARELFSPLPRTVELSMGSDDGLQVYLNGRLVHEARINRGAAPDQEQVSFEIPAGRSTLVCKFVNTGGSGGMYHRAIVADEHLQGDAVAMVLPETLVPEQLTIDRDAAWRLAFSPRYRALTDKMDLSNKEVADIRDGAPRTMVMKERDEPRMTYVMMRGAYYSADESRPVSRAVPAVLGSIEGDDLNRLDLAQWTVGDDNPITSRVFANRLWQHFFGRGLTDTVDDFGVQGQWPTHPGLLDWLAADLRDDWNVQDTIRQIVLSATYRQTAGVGDGTYATYPRQRLSAEQIRDQALHVSGLLVEQAGGPSVKPYQPDGLWQEVAMPQSNTRTFMQGEGDDLWRRSLYTYWKRAAPPPSLMTFDAPTREFCTARRISTNTPLQALVLWNDPQFVEAARETAARVMESSGGDQDRLTELYRRCTGSPPTPSIATAMQTALESWRTRYSASVDDAAALISVGETPTPEDVDSAELAAWTMLASAVLSSDAALVKD